MQDTNFCSKSIFSWTFSYTDCPNTKYIKHATETKKKPAWSWRHHLRPTRETNIIIYHYRYVQWKSTWSAHSKWKGTFCNWLFKASLSCNTWQWQNFHETCKLPSKTLMRSSLMFFANSKSWRHMKYFFQRKEYMQTYGPWSNFDFGLPSCPSP